MLRRRSVGHQDFVGDHSTFSTVRADGGIDTGEAIEQLLPGQWETVVPRVLLLKAHEGFAPIQFGVSVATAQDTVVPDPDESFGQDVEQETADELEGVQGHGLDPVAVGVVSVSEGDLVAIQAEDAVVGDGYPVGISAQVVDDPVWASEGGFAVDVPVFVVEARQQALEGRGRLSGFDLSREDQFTVRECLFEKGEELASE